MFYGGSKTPYSIGQVDPVLHGDFRNYLPDPNWELVQNEEQVSSSKGMWRHQTAAGPGLITYGNAS